MTEADYETLLPAGCAVHVLATPADDAAATLALLAEAVGAGSTDLPAESYAPFAPPALPDEPNVPRKYTPAVHSTATMYLRLIGQIGPYLGIF